MAASASTFTAIGMAPALAVELASQINAGTGDAKGLMARGMSYVTANAIETGINEVGGLTIRELTSLGIPPEVAEAIVDEEAGNQKPVNTVAPVLSGTATVGEVITSTPGTWSGPGPFTYSRTWYRDDVAISGQTNATYTLAVEDVDAMISVEVTATNAAGSATQAGSNEIGPVAAA